MSKSTTTYWNVLNSINASEWEVIDGTDGMLEKLTLAMDEESGDYTRLTRIKKGADTMGFGGKSHDYPEEIYIVSGRLYDAAFDMCLEAWHFVSRPPGEVHGLVVCEEECLVLEILFLVRHQMQFYKSELHTENGLNGLKAATMLNVMYFESANFHLYLDIQ